MKERIYRATHPSALIYRSDGDEPMVEGRVVPYEEWTEVDSVFEGHFMEKFAPGALRKSFSEKIHRMRGFFEHGRSKLLGEQAIMEIREMWEQPDGAYFRASLLDGLPELFVDGIRRGQYGASIGAEKINVARSKFPGKSSHNPKGIEERVVKEAKAFDISLTALPWYPNTDVVMRSATDELAVQELMQDPERLVQLIAKLAEPTHSEPTAPDAEAVEETDEPPAEEPVEEQSEEQPPADPEQPEGSRDTQPPHDYLADEREEDWQL